MQYNVLIQWLQKWAFTFLNEYNSETTVLQQKLLPLKIRKIWHSHL